MNDKKQATRDVADIYQLPTKVRYCTRCVMSNQRPRITFDKTGVCSACLYFDYKNHGIDWDERHNFLTKLCEKYRRNNGTYDVVVPCSGGKDGSRVAWRLKHEFGMNPLTVTWAPNLFTSVGWENLQSFINAGFDNILVSPNRTIHRKLVRSAFEQMGEPFQPFIFGQYTAPFRVALQYDIKLVFYGEDAECEYGGSMASFDRPSLPWNEFSSVRFSKMGVEKFSLEGFSKNKLQYYTLSEPEIKALKSQNIQQHFMSFYMNWIPQENYYAAVENYGFKTNTFGRSEGTFTKYASLDDMLDGFHYYLMYIKFGIGRATSDAAHEIRDGYITREEAIGLVRKYDGGFPDRYFAQFLEFCELDETEFWAIVDSWRATHLWRKVQGSWQVIHQVKATDDQR